jgi:hypothetical protein
MHVLVLRNYNRDLAVDLDVCNINRYAIFCGLNGRPRPSRRSKFSGFTVFEFEDNRLYDLIRNISLATCKSPVIHGSRLDIQSQPV